jgi:hypothetical protein
MRSRCRLAGLLFTAATSASLALAVGGPAFAGATQGMSVARTASGLTRTGVVLGTSDLKALPT